ncbi:YHYH protein [Bremerella sp. JC817]|uniref:YHYH protein n=1 Tax=Bremerella sp. JC817 TaxID=3231756 RepID=UPI003459693D
MILKNQFALLLFFAIALGSAPMLAQFAPRFRQHDTNQSRGLRLVPADSRPPGASQVSIEVVGSKRIIQSNGIPDHQTGAFPNHGNPNGISQQQYVYRVAAEPKPADRITPLGMQNFGIGVNGIPFDPGAAEWFHGDPRGGWQYEALSGAVPLGIDTNHAHVQPTGAYHYHGLPSGLLKSLKVVRGQHSPIVGWAADGFPIYALYGYQDANNAESEIVELKSSYRLKRGERPRGNGNPGGQYDGTFLADHEFVEGAGDLDECNGRFGVTPDYPEGTYAYYLSDQWPVIPRNFRGEPSSDFDRGGPGQQGPPGGQRRPGFGPPPPRPRR